MARYDFRCAKCKVTVEETRPMSDSDKSGKCKKCGQKTKRLYSSDICIIIFG